MAAHSAINTFIFIKKLGKKIIFCGNQVTGKAMNLGKPLIKKQTQTFPKMWDAEAWGLTGRHATQNLETVLKSL